MPTHANKQCALIPLALGTALSLTLASGCGSTDTVKPAETSQTVANPQTAMVPAWTNDGRPRQIEILEERPNVKVAAIGLRRGTALPTHRAASPVTIQVLRGAGEFELGDERFDVTEGSVVYVGANLAHAMTPKNDALVVLLVHYLKHNQS